MSRLRSGDELPFASRGRRKSSQHSAACVAWLFVSVAAAGCAAHRPVTVDPAEPAPSAGTSAGHRNEAPLKPDATAVPTPLPKTGAGGAQTIETTDPQLAAALRTAILAPSPANYRALAAEYKRLGVFDQAQSYLITARDLSPHDPATSDALARLWRDAGFPRFGLADAQRAVSYAPQSPIVHNTLGTVLQALGERTLAIKEYERALALDEKAAYALNNLCYAWLLEREPARAAAACRKALDLDPAMTAARNNLALAYAAEGRTRAAREAFESSGDSAAAKYNIGIVHLAQRDYKNAVEAFVEAHRLRPSNAALARARQASTLAAAEE